MMLCEEKRETMKIFFFHLYLCWCVEFTKGIEPLIYDGDMIIDLHNSNIAWLFFPSKIIASLSDLLIDKLTVLKSILYFSVETMIWILTDKSVCMS